MSPASAKPSSAKTVLVVEDSPLKTFIDRVVVPALVDKVLAEQAASPSIPVTRSA